MSELIFVVEEALDGGFTARALGQSIFTEADTLRELPAKVRDAVHCHFKEEKGLNEAPRSMHKLNRALEDQAVVAQEERRLQQSQRPELFEASRFHHPLRLLGPTAECKLVVDGLPTIAINYRREMRPAILPTRKTRHIHGPSFVTLTGSTHPTPDLRSWVTNPLMDQPASASTS
jgi:hypothetical protein